MAQFLSNNSAAARLRLNGHRRVNSYLPPAQLALQRERMETEQMRDQPVATPATKRAYLELLCELLMENGAPAHHLVEIMTKAADVITTKADFVQNEQNKMTVTYSGDDTDPKIIRASDPSVSFNKLDKLHQIIERVASKKLGVVAATLRLREVKASQSMHDSKLFIVLMSGLACASVGPLGFRAGFLDLPVIFALGCLFAWVKRCLLPGSDTVVRNSFELLIGFVIAFTARALGSIGQNNILCFPAIAQASLALALPGFAVLCALLEAKARSPTKLKKTVVDSSLLFFGVVLGSQTYGFMDISATTRTACRVPMNPYWNILFVPLFTFSQIMLNDGKWRQIPPMLFVACCGYAVSFFSGLNANMRGTMIPTFLASTTIGALSHLYARFSYDTGKFILHAVGSSKPMEHPLGFGAALPAIFLQAPGGFTISGSMITAVASGTGHPDLYKAVFSVWWALVMVAITIASGLYVGALVVYPVCRRRSATGSFTM